MNFMPLLKKIKQNLPTAVSAIVLAIAVWTLAVTNTDPVEMRNLGRPVEIEISGQNPSYVITNDVPQQISVTLSAPNSTWDTSLTATSSVRAIIDLSGLNPGRYTVPINVQVSAQPVKIESYMPDVVEVQLEEIYSEAFTITLQQPSSPGIGYEAGKPQLDAEVATISGPSSAVERVVDVYAVLDVSQAVEDIDEELPLRAVDDNGVDVDEVSISPEIVNVKVPISQRGGYRNVTVKVVTSGQIASGFRLTNISSNPLVVTVFSSDPDLVNELPGFVETQPLNLTDASEEMVVSLPLNLPQGITVVGESTIKVSVSIAPIQGSITLSSLPIETIGGPPDLEAVLSPDRVDVILSGPLPTLDELTAGNVRVLVDLTDQVEGIVQLEPSVEINIQGVLVQSLLPATVEVELKPFESSELQ